MSRNIMIPDPGFIKRLAFDYICRKILILQRLYNFSFHLNLFKFYLKKKKRFLFRDRLYFYVIQDYRLTKYNIKDLHLYCMNDTNAEQSGKKGITRTFYPITLIFIETTNTFQISWQLHNYAIFSLQVQNETMETGFATDFRYNYFPQ